MTEHLPFPAELLGTGAVIFMEFDRVSLKAAETAKSSLSCPSPDNAITVFKMETGAVFKAASRWHMHSLCQRTYTSILSTAESALEDGCERVFQFGQRV